MSELMEKSLHELTLKSMDSIVIENKKHTQALADYVWQAMDDAEQYPNLEKNIIERIYENFFKTNSELSNNLEKSKQDDPTLIQNIIERLCRS